MGLKIDRRVSNIICGLKSNDISINFQSCHPLVFSEGVIRCKLSP